MNTAVLLHLLLTSYLTVHLVGAQQIFVEFMGPGMMLKDDENGIKQEQHIN